MVDTPSLQIVKQHGPVEDVPVYQGGVGIDDILGPLKPKPFHDSITLSLFLVYRPYSYIGMCAEGRMTLLPNNSNTFLQSPNYFTF